MTLYILFGVLLAGILASVLMSPSTIQTVKGYMKTLPSSGISPEWKQRGWYVGVSLFLLFTLWVFREEVPFWNLWRENETFFWMSLAIILVLALTWRMGGGMTLLRWVLVFVLLSVMVAAVIRTIIAAGSGPDSSASAPTPTPVVNPVTEVPRMAIPGVWSEWVTIPPYSSVRIAPKGKIWIQDLHGNEWDDEPGKVQTRGKNDVANFAFRFASATSEPTEVAVYHHRK